MAFKKILAIKLRSLGDTVLMTAPLKELHRAFPHAQIDVAVLTSWAPLLENLPGVPLTRNRVRPHHAVAGLAVSLLRTIDQQAIRIAAVRAHPS